MYVCSCFGITEAQVKKHADAGACTPRQIASACKAGTDCGGCVRRIQALLGRDCSRHDLANRQAEPAAASVTHPVTAPVPTPVAAVALATLRDVRLSDAA
ncbi:(2Fe-2S)-binding protein [Streptomyces microflavus]|uniref:Bacterioferritin-associated ferredoxin n=2 Tax=Streptomyces microflavus TaxID=1919 RepID=A0A7J0CLD4_STRMI|nr:MULTISPECIES: (2Fe-2S)-binding protein [Streptomyces]MCX4651833.1 (2Fe-2S)-binding protein [Streptomyces microflavus]MDX2976529.1 (2Fe-2S)-binding protein [Streptomyces sp. NRRL_B-2249]WSA60204.1 (2Fe-2S)-binding protein [Streptomyces microflavus]WSS37244.1 (2Fe-2S)-binding protein [Streptomyces microflavus]WST19679.1 (2Fe-2S)-binding protein [Streptomyces microflavus]